MPKIITLLYLLFFNFGTQAQTIKLKSIKGNQVQFSVINNSKEDLELAINKGKLVFIEVKLWENDLGCKLITEYAKKLSDGGGLVGLDSTIIKPQSSKDFTINLNSFKTQSDEAKKIFERFLDREKGEVYHIRIIFDDPTTPMSSKLKKV